MLNRSSVFSEVLRTYPVAAKSGVLNTGCESCTAVGDKPGTIYMRIGHDQRTIEEKRFASVRMGTIFVAYGEPGQRTSVLSFAADQAAASGHDLFVYHIHESEKESAEQIRDEIERIIKDTDPSVPFTVQINTPEESSDLTNSSKQKRLLDAIFESETDYEYIVMGDIERNVIEDLTHASITEAVLEQHTIPVMLVPV